jgi:hypothetical protein
MATLSGFCRVKEAATSITLTIDPAPDEFIRVTPAQLALANGFHLAFDEDWSTVATLTRQHRIVVGGGYSGCLYSVYHDGHGNYKCVHTARPAGVRSDAFVVGIRTYARDRRWTLVHEVPTVADGTSGAGIGGCVTTFLATRVSYTTAPTPIVRTVRLRQDAQGRSVHQDRFETPTP